jgi:plasmid replication initiation protein
MRMVDARLRGLEERIALEQATLRNDLGRQLAELEEASKKEFAVQAERLSAERAKRADDLRALSAEFKEAFKNLERRHLKFEEATSQADAEVRDQLVKQNASFTAELTRTAERLTSELDRAASARRAPNVDTTTLARPRSGMAPRQTRAGRAAGKGNNKS